MDEEDSFPLECSSGCESGWTMYLDQSCGKPISVPSKRADFHGMFEEDEREDDKEEILGGFGEEEEEEDDLSMISDASSGPPQFHEDDYSDETRFFFSASSAALMKNNSREGRARAEKQVETSPFLDDTASSHVFSFSKSNFNLTSKQSSVEDALDFSIGFSATNFKKH